ncbi:MAG TPA: cellulose synthase operon protein YhjQ/BcsQ, partial [Myxococcota bacterium]|nr:cellulose synthase operon protein YhjQ/BcsQ [Myxococcota bacterium]
MNLLSARELLERIDHCFPGSQRRWSFPFTYVDLVADDLPDDEDDREAEVARRLELSVAALRAHGSRLFLRIEPRRSDEPSELLQSAGAWWGRALQEDEGAPELVPGARVVHFYGYKGGQARSTLLAFLARALAADGWRALVVDVDAEAPSLDLLFDVRLDAPAASLVGARADLPIAPARVVTPGFSEGYADLLAFRPHGATWDQDAAALALEVGTSPHASSSLARRVLRSAGAYDVVLVDHRTGLSPTVLPWMEAAPGALVVFARLDRQWQAAREHLAELWRRVPASVGGAVISLAPPVPSLDAYRAENEPEGVELLDLMARALDPQGESLSGEQLLPQWIVWPHDPVFTGGRVPEVTQVGGPTRDRLAELRRVLGLSGRHERAERAPTHAKSGALDEGTLIVTRALRELSIPNNPYRIVIGRKGTGKTRLVRALVEQRLAEPLLVAPDADEATGGFNMSVEVKELERRTADDPEAFWWTLLRAALRHPRARRDVLLAAL